VTEGRLGAPGIPAARGARLVCVAPRGPEPEPEVAEELGALPLDRHDRFIKDTIAAMAMEIARDPDLEAKCAAALRSCR
jgi:hypothetical protein